MTMDPFVSVTSGILTGLFVAAPVGPMAILCMNRTMVGGLQAGISTGLGASTVHVVYASVALLGLHQLLPLLETARPVLSAVSAAVMIVFAIRILRPRRVQNSSSDRGTITIVRNYASAIAFNCLNPMLLVLLFGAVAVIVEPGGLSSSLIPVVALGAFLGSIGWWIILCSLTAALRSRLDARVMAAINRLAAIGMIGFAVRALI